MFAKRVITHLQKYWPRPAVRVAVEDLCYTLGQGQVAAEIIIHRPTLLWRLWRCPSLAFGESYMKGDIEVRGHLLDVLEGFYCAWPGIASEWHNRMTEWCHSLSWRNSRRQAISNARHHYNIGNDFYKLWLDPTLTYSCAYFLHEDDDLATAQQQKLEVVCQKACLRPGKTLLDIGCGWGSLLFHAARHHGVLAVGVTPVKAQADYIEAEARRQRLGDQVRVICGDWRDVTGRFDRIISIGMFEHVGLKQYPAFFRRWHELLMDGGLSVLHTIGRMKPQPVDPWIRRYIFPGGYLPALTQITSHVAGADLWVGDIENLHLHYARTLSCWSERFQAVRDRVVSMYDESFARMWWLYLQGAEAGFRWGDLQLWQVVLMKDKDAPLPLDRRIDLQRAGADYPTRTVMLPKA